MTETQTPSSEPKSAQTDRWSPPGWLEELRADRGRLVLWAVATVLFFTTAYVVWRFVGPIVFGVFVYYVIRPIVDRVTTRVGSRTLAVALSLLLVAVPALLLVVWTLAIVLNSLSGVLGSETFDRFAAFLQPYIDVAALIGEGFSAFEAILVDPGILLESGLGDSLAAALSFFQQGVVVAFGVGLDAFISLVIAFYLLRDDIRIAAWARETFVTPRGLLDRYLTAVDTDLASIYFGNILNAVATAVLGVIVFTALNQVAPAGVAIPQAALVGVLMGVASLIPVVGMKLVEIPVAAVLVVNALLTDPATLWFPALFLIVSFVIVDYIPDQLLRPYVSGRSLHVGAIMLAYLFGPLLFGWYGIFLGPFVLVVVFEFAREVLPWLVNPERYPEDLDAVAGESDSEPDVGAETADETASKVPSEAEEIEGLGDDAREDPDRDPDPDPDRDRDQNLPGTSGSDVDAGGSRSDDTPPT
jgi:predicted PurR-regulated permease PerM